MFRVILSIKCVQNYIVQTFERLSDLILCQVKIFPDFFTNCDSYKY